MKIGQLGTWMVLALATAASGVGAQGIYTCVDAKGRKLTSDRPIAECADREQKELTSAGTVKRTVKPVPTAEEAARQEVRDRAEAEERAQVAEAKRRDRALLIRFPNRFAHDKERAEALASVDEVTKAANRRLFDLLQQRKQIDNEMEFYRKNPNKAPAALQRQLQENDSSIEIQKRFIAAQGDEKKRVNAHFDEELVKLTGLWALQTTVVPAPAAPSPSSSAKR